jgi:hypothetical protein
MRIIQRKVIGKPLALSDPEDLGTREVDLCHGDRHGRQQRVPAAEHVHRHNVLRAARRVVRKRPEVHDRGATHRRTPDRSQIKEIFSISQIKDGHLMARALQMGRQPAHQPGAMSGNENAHASMISIVPGAVHRFPSRVSPDR